VDSATKRPENTKSQEQRSSSQSITLFEWRQKTLAWLMHGLSLFSLPILVLALYHLIRFYNLGHYSLSHTINISILYLVVYIYILRITYSARINYFFRVVSILLLLLLLGGLILKAGGLSGNALLFFFSTIALAAVFLDLRQVLIFQAISLGIMAVLAFLLISGRYVIPPELLTNSTSLLSWLGQGLNFILLSAMVLFSISNLVRRLERSISSSKKKTEHLSLLQNVTLDILAHKKMGELLDSLTEKAADLVNADGGVFFLVDQGGEILTMMGKGGKKEDQLKRELRQGQGIAGRVLEMGTPLVLPDYSQWQERDEDEVSLWGSIMQVPVYLGEKVIGVLGCYTLAGNLRDFNKDDLSMIEGLASQAAIAIENIKLIDAAQQAEARLDTVVQAAPSAIISVDHDQNILMFNKAAEKIFGYTADEVVGKNVSVLIPERFHHSHADYVDEFTKKPSNENAMLISRELLGQRSNGEEFPVEVSVSQVVSHGAIILTVIIQDITLRKKTQDALRNSERRAKILLNLSKSLEISKTYEEILEASLKIIEDFFGYRNIWFYLYSNNRDRAELIGAAGWKAEQIRKDAPILQIRGDAFLEEIAEGHAPIVIEDARTDPRTNKDAVAHFENRTLVHVPTYLLDRHLGAIGMGSFGNEDLYVPTPSELDFLSAMASHIAISIDRITQTDQRARAEAEIIRSNQNQTIINTLLQLALQDISLTEKLEQALEIILSTPWFSILPKGAIFLADKEDDTLKMIVHSNLDQGLQIACAIVKPGICLCGKAAADQELLFSASGSPHHKAHVGESEEHSHYNVPISLGKRLLGIFVLYLPKEHSSDKKEIEFLRTVANTLAGLIDRAKAQEKIKSMNADLILAYDSTLEGWAKALDLRDKETGDHTLRVAELTVNLARSMGTPNENLLHIWRGALLHDIGKMSIPDTTLKKADSLTTEEWETMRQHPQNAYDMLSSIPYLEKALDIPYCHHEKWDGSGYPRGLKGEDIPFAARIFSVVDVWDALRSDRPYRLAWEDEKVVRYIRERAGVEFDPQVVDAFFALVGK
jgi:PAS domain S-box-containing protein/putative nucleotidyltransferase with HDIG domain